jgi:hypothetical protein
MVALFAFALRYKRLFLLHWPAAAGLLASPWLQWGIEPEQLPLLLAELQGMQLEERWGRAGEGVWATEEPSLSWPEQLPISPYLVTNRGAWSFTSTAAHMAWLDELTGSTPACLHQVLLRPLPAVLSYEPVAAALQQLAAARAAGQRILGLHFRAGDAAMQGQATAAALPAAVEAALTAALSAAAPHLSSPKATLFFLSDVAATRAAVRSLHPGALFSSVAPQHVAPERLPAAELQQTAAERLRSAISDWWLLSQVDAQLGELNSGFSRAALLASKAGVFHAGQGCEPCCGQQELYCHQGLGQYFLKHGGMHSGVR